MLRDNLVGLIEPMRISAGVDPLALSIQTQASDDRSSCLENPRPQGAESSLTENVTSPFQAEPAHNDPRLVRVLSKFHHEIENDPGVWNRVGLLIESEVSSEVSDSQTSWESGALPTK